ncbi:MAG: DUF5615 family PIN-like protein, partial [Spirochaetales bacterium]|nr:DUF5615 family PIN-like protein [Spirochaetales bacterium]
RNIEAIHWSSTGKPDAPDQEILEYASSNRYVIFTHDLDFGFLLARSLNATPSVIQSRIADLRPESIGDVLLATLEQFQRELEAGCLLTIQEDRTRVRLLPFMR